MGKRLRRGGGRSPFSPSVIDRSSLLRRMKSLNLDIFSEPYTLIERLRERYPDYARIKLKPFSDRINETLKSLRSSSLKFPAASSASAAAYGSSFSSSSSSDGDDADEQRRSRRRRIKEDASEERLLRAESEHLRRRLSTQGGPSSSSLEPSDDSTSTSEDAAFEGKVNLEFDITKSMLRERYANQSALRKKSREEVKNVEIEAVVNEIGKAEMAVTRKGSGQEVPLTKGVGDHSYNVQSRGMVKEGPKFRDLGGMNKVLEELMMEVIVPLCHPELPERLGVKPVSGILLHGPPGCGKTKLAHAIANETGLSFYKISATEVVSGVSGASEENIRDLFNKAYRTAPSIVFIDEIDAIASKRENLQREMERRIVTQLMICMDELHQTIKVADADAHFDPDNQKSSRMPGYVLVIGATNRPDAVDQALRRPGRFDKEIGLGVPDENAREQILSVLIRNLRLEGEFDIHMIAKSTPGFVGADLAALVNKAGNLAMKRILDRRKSQLIGRLSEDKDWWRHPWSFEEVEGLCITMLDFMEASKLVQPSTRREGFSSIPDVSWEDVGGLDSLRKAFDRYVVQPIKQPEDYEELGVDMKEGFMLYGPPGCGKTLIAKAVANEAGANFIHIKGPEIVRKFVGDSEQEVRMIFTRARCCSPCIIFFDEIDSLAPKRGGEGAWAMERALNQLLVELDGANQRHGVYVIGATNRIDNIDAAIMRPGRFGRVFYVPLPSADERLSILKALGRKKPISPDVDLNALAFREECRNLTGADLYALMNEAAIIVREEKKMCVDQGVPYSQPLVIKTSHFEKAFQSITPSVTQEDVRFYESLRRIRAP